MCTCDDHYLAGAVEQSDEPDKVRAADGPPRPLQVIRVFDRREGFVAVMPDWRLQGQEAYLSGISLERRVYEPSPGNDHDHCEFCSAKFMQGKETETLQQGYCSPDRYRWICVQCFEDFLPKFGWRVVVDSSAQSGAVRVDRPE